MHPRAASMPLTTCQFTGVFRAASLLLVVTGLGILSGCPVASAQESVADRADAPPAVRLVRVPLPIQGTVDTRVTRVLDQLLNDLPRNGTRPTVVLELAAEDGSDGSGSEFGRVLQLAQHLASPQLSGVRTVAYIPRTVKGHAVLVALACEEIIMHPDAELGEAGAGESRLDAIVRSGYREIADRRRTIPAAVALGMLDPQLQVQQVQTAGGVRYLLAEDVPELQRSTTVQSVDTIIPAGEMGLFRGDELRVQYNFVSHLARDRVQLAAALGVPPQQLEQDPSLGGSWRAVRVELQGAINASDVDRIVRATEEQLRQNAVNFICLQIGSPGGSPRESVRLANYLAGLDPSRVRTVAYVPREARADAAIVALACDQLLMAEDALLGGSGAYQMDRSEIDIASEAIQQIAAEKGRRWSLAAALIDPQRQVFRYTLQGSNVDEYLSPQERQEQPDPGRFEQHEEVTRLGEPLQVDGSRAVDLGLARLVVASLAELRQQYQIEDELRELRPNWALELVHALASPQVAATLLFVGGFALIAELSAPGIGVGGFVSALCFMLFFWSNFLNGTAGWLEVILFVGGLTFVALEVFVLPGFGIFGLGGGLMLLASLVLASQTFVWPQNDYQMRQLPRSLLVVLAALAGIVFSAALMRRYMTKAPFLRRIALPAPEGEQLEDLHLRESVVDFRYLLGQHGLTTTPLNPSGKAEFDGRVVNVVSDGDAISRGCPVVVVEVAGNRVVVSAADAQA
jgi:membrane-bound ClpP family serine protease